VGELEALNPDALSGFLQIGQGLILPPPPTPQPFSSGGTAVPLLLRVVDLQLLTTRSGALLVLGEVENQGEEAVENVQVSLALVGDQGGPVAEGRTWIAEPIIPPGETGPFVFRFPQMPAENIQPQVNIISGQTVVDLGSRTLALLVADDLIVEFDERQVSLRGEVINIGETTLSEILLVASFYDEMGHISGYQQLHLAVVLPAGERTGFSIQAAPPGLVPIAAEVTVFGTEVAGP
jgi:hypothetical protein